MDNRGERQEASAAYNGAARRRNTAGRGTSIVLSLLLCAIMTGLGVFLWRLYDDGQSRQQALDRDLSAALVRVESLESELAGLQAERDTLNSQLDELQSRLDESDLLFYEPPPPADAVILDPPPAIGDEPPVRELYPELMVPPASPYREHPGVIFLTLDDGPSKYTETVLDILAKHGVKATFFVVARPGMESWRTELLKRMAAEGHTVGIHTASHEYRRIYASPEAYLDDFKLAYDTVTEFTGVKPWAFRFPGGSINSYNQNTYRSICDEMTRRGFVYWDWNCSAQDASNTVTSQGIWNNMVRDLSLERRNVLLCHDTKRLTVELLDSFITEMLAKGYTFAPLTPDVQPVCFSRQN